MSNPQPKGNSIGKKVDDLDSSDANDFFEGRHWHTDNTLNITHKFATKVGSVKFALKTKQGKNEDGSLSFNATNESEINAAINGKNCQFKFKGSKITSHFDLGYKTIGNHWFNPYISVTTPTSFTNLNDQSKTTLGGLFHFNFGKNNSFNGVSHTAFNFSKNSNSKYNFKIEKLTNITTNNFSLSHYGLAKPAGDKLDGTNQLAVQYEGENSTAYVSGEFSGLCFTNGASSVSGGLTHQATKKVLVAVDVNKDLSQEGQDINVGLGYQHCSGLGFKLALNNFNTLNFLTNLKFKKCCKADISACVKTGFKGEDFAWGLKATLKH